MIDRSHTLPLTRQAQELGISRGSVYYLPKPVSAADLAIMRQIDELHLEFPFAGSRMLRDLLRQEGIKIGRLHVATPICCEGWRLCGPIRSGQPISAISRWQRVSSIWWLSSTGSVARFSHGDYRSRWGLIFASRPWKKHWPAMATLRYSIPTRAVSSPAWLSPACCCAKKSPSAWTAGVHGATTSL